MTAKEYADNCTNISRSGIEQAFKDGERKAVLEIMKMIKAFHKPFVPVTGKEIIITCK